MPSLQPLGDQAVLATFSSEEQALHLARLLRHRTFPWLVDVVQAYRTVAVFYDLETTGYHPVAEIVNDLLTQEETQAERDEGKLHTIPCCYAHALDLERVSDRTGLTIDDIIALHTSTEYTVYAIGFCPGFPYLGYLPEPLCGVPRLETPRLRVEAGSVGLTGRQTGIYTEPRPGGWNIIGRTPLELVHVADAYFPLRTGDRVRFVAIDPGEFERLRGKRLG
jgi:inhibitor of KinA